MREDGVVRSAAIGEEFAVRWRAEGCWDGLRFVYLGVVGAEVGWEWFERDWEREVGEERGPGTTHVEMHVEGTKSFV